MKQHILEKDVESAKLELKLAIDATPKDAARVDAAEKRVRAAEKRLENVTIPTTAAFLPVASSVQTDKPLPVSSP